MAKEILTISNLYTAIGNKDILKGVTLTIKRGEVHAIMGPNGAGKSTLALSMMGYPHYSIPSQTSKSEFQINGEDMLSLSPEERAAKGLFVSFQQPVEIAGVPFLAFLRTAYKALHPEEKIPLSVFKQHVKEALAFVGLSEVFMRRFLNEGFSGGEKKRAEIAQMIVLKPKFIVLDEIDSGLDVDSLKLVAKAVKDAVKQYDMGVLLITHYQRILHLLKPDKVHVLMDGKIKRSGSMSLVRHIEKEGYAAI